MCEPKAFCAGPLYQGLNLCPQNRGIIWSYQSWDILWGIANEFYFFRIWIDNWQVFCLGMASFGTKKGRVQLKVQLDWNFWSCLESLLHGQPWIFNIVNKLSGFVSSPQKSHQNHAQLWKLWACHISLDWNCYHIGIWYRSLYNTLQ